MSMFAHPRGWHGDAGRRHQVHATIIRFILTALLFLVPFSSVPAQECYQPGTYLPLVGDNGDEIGTCDEIEIIQSWAYVIRSSPEPWSLVVWSLNDPENPEIVATATITSEAHDLRAQGNLLFFASDGDSHPKMHIWDVSNPYTPVEVGSMITGSRVLDLEVEGSLVALAISDQVRFVNVSDPTNPILLSGITPSPSQSEVPNVDLFPTYAVCNVRGHDFGVSVVSTLNPSVPTLTMYEETGVWLRGFTMEDNGRYGWASNSDMILYRVDIENTGGGVIKPVGNGGFQTRVFDDLVITMGRYGINPRVHIKDSDRNLSLRDLWPDRVYDMARKGNFLVSVMGTGGLQVRRITLETPAPFTGSVPSARTTFPSGPNLGPTDTPGLFLEVNSQHSRLGVIDYTDPDQPRFRGTWECDNPTAAAARGEDVVVATGNGVHLLRLGPDGHLEYHSSLPSNTEVRSVLWDGDLLWLGAVPDLYQYDMSDPDSPVLLNQIPLLGSLRQLEKKGDYLVVGSYLSGVFMLDVSTFPEPVVLGHLGGVGAEYMSVLGDFAYVGSRLQSLVKVVSLADPMAPIVVDTLLLPSRLYAVLAHDQQLWVGRHGDVEVFHLMGGMPQTTPFYQAVGSYVGGFLRTGDLVAVGSDLTYLMRMPCHEVAAVTSPRITLHQDLPSVPNPFNPRTTISFETTGHDHASLSVYDLRGHLVAILLDEIIPAGFHEVDWDGRDDAGRKVPSGVYLSRLEIGGKVAQGRMTLVR